MLRAGIELDEFQRDILDAGMAISGDRWASDEVAVIVPRQNGKSLALVARAIWGPTVGGERLVLFTAHEFKTCREAFLLAKSILETPAFEEFKPKISVSHGKEGVTFANGSRILFIARSRTSGRGFSPDCVILDEAFELDDLALAALKPSLAAAKHAQIWYASSAPHETSEVLRRLALKGRAGEAERFTYVEWCADSDAVPGDVEAWKASNPALGTRISLEAVTSELEALKPEDFARERLGIWRTDATAGPFDRAQWDSLARAASPGSIGRRALGLDITPDRRRACVAAAAELDDGRVLVEVLEEREGVSWVVDKLAALEALHKPDAVVLDAAGQARSLVSPLQTAGIYLTVTDLRTMSNACGAFYDAVVESRLVHRGQPVLDAAVAGAKQRVVQDAWAWGRRTSRTNVSPLVAATLAVWGVVGIEPQEIPQVIAL